MNNQFLKLSIQADNFMDRKYPLWRDTKLYENVWQQKFAELIVRECASIADEPTSQPFDSYGKKIKEHFGVEE